MFEICLPFFLVLFFSFEGSFFVLLGSSRFFSPDGVFGDLFFCRWVVFLHSHFVFPHGPWSKSTKQQEPHGPLVRIEFLFLVFSSPGLLVNGPMFGPFFGDVLCFVWNSLPLSTFLFRFFFPLLVPLGVLSFWPYPGNLSGAF